MIGASQFSSPCTYCVAHDLSASAASTVVEKPYWLGAVLGTAAHLLLEHRVRKRYPGALVEKKVVLGELPGYGQIKSTLDLYLPPDRAVVDWKTTTRDKLFFLKEASRSEPEAVEPSKLTSARFTFHKYRGQLMSYGRGLTLAGHPVDSVHMAFVCRDGKTDDDVWAWDEPYDPEYAEKVWDRLDRLWTFVQNGGDIEGLPSKPGCYTCETEGRV